MLELKELRLNRGLGLAQAADEIGVDKSVLSRAEKGETEPHPKNKLKIADFYELSVTDIWPVSTREPEEAAA